MKTGHAVESAQIEVALTCEGSLVSANRGVTGDNGVAFVELQTFDSPSGVTHWGRYQRQRRVFRRISDNPEREWSVRRWLPSDRGLGRCHRHTRVQFDRRLPDRRRASQGLGSNLSASSAISRPNTLRCISPPVHSARDAPNLVRQRRQGGPQSPYRISRQYQRGLGRPTTTASCGASLVGAGRRVIAARLTGVGDADALRTCLDQGEPVVVWLALWGDESITETGRRPDHTRSPLECT